MANKIVFDFSEHNTIKSSDWDNLKKMYDEGKCSGIILRIGLRGSLKSNPTYYAKIRYDFKFKEYLAEVKKRGLPYSVYFFPTAISENEAHEEGEWLVQALKDNAIDPSIPVCQDSEIVDSANKNGRADKLSKANRTKFINIVNQHLKDAGYDYGIYASTSWFYDCLNDNDLLEGTYRWVAQYASKCTYKGKIDMWQYTSKYPMSFSKNGVDASYCYSEIKTKSKSEVKEDKKEEPKEDSKNTGTNDIKDEKKEEKVMITEADCINKMIEIASNEVGYLEKKSNSNLYSKTGNAGYNNYTKYGYEMHKIQPSNMDFPAAWCNTFTDWIILETCKAFGKGTVEAKKVLCGNFDDYTVYSSNYYKKKGRWFTKNPKAGDQIFFKNNNGICHTGIVYRVDSSKVYTIEGNTSSASGVVANGGCVAKKSYNLSYSKIAGYGRPDWSSIVGTTVIVSNDTNNTDSLKGKSATIFTVSGTFSPNKTTKFVGTVTASSLNIRKWAGTENDKVSFSPLANGSKVNVCDAILDNKGTTWYYINYSNKFGFVSSDYIKKG